MTLSYKTAADFIGEWLKREDASMAIETVLVMPVYVAIAFLSYSFMDAYRTMISLQRAAYSIADIITRKEEVDAAYVIGLARLSQALVGTHLNSDISIASISRSIATGDLSVDWSTATADFPYGDLKNTGPARVEPSLPNIVEGDSIILVEMTLQYNPVFPNIPGFGKVFTPNQFEVFVPMIPRYNKQICSTWVDCVDD